jgi:hypothetical protein
MFLRGVILILVDEPPPVFVGTAELDVDDAAKAGTVFIVKNKIAKVTLSQENIRFIFSSQPHIIVFQLCNIVTSKATTAYKC